jgi:ankyrin repeat protein
MDTELFNQRENETFKKWANRIRDYLLIVRSHRSIPNRPKTREKVHKYINRIKKYAHKPNRKDSWGDTALYKSMCFQCYEFAKYLLKCGADVNVKNLINDTILHQSYRLNNEFITFLLENYNCNINEKNDVGFTQFHCYLMRRKYNYLDPDITIKMIDYGANIKDIDIKLKLFGQTVFEYAQVYPGKSAFLRWILYPDAPESQKTKNSILWSFTNLLPCKLQIKPALFDAFTSSSSFTVNILYRLLKLCFARELQ